MKAVQHICGQKKPIGFSFSPIAMVFFLAAQAHATPAILDVRDIDTPGADSVLHVGGLTDNVSGFVDRGDRQKAIESLQRAGEILHREGAVVVMFPEGTRTRDGNLLPFKKGAFVLAAQSQVPLVPVGISGSRAIMPKGSWRVTPGTIRVRIGEPIPTHGLGEEQRNYLLEESRKAIEGLREPLLEPTDD